MADLTQQIVIEIIADTSQLTPALDQLQQQGTIDSQSAAIFKKTNDQLKARNALLSSNLQQNDALTLSVTEQQATYNKLVSSVKNLSGASKEAVQSLLKMSTGQVAQGFKEAAVDVDDYITVLENANQSQTKVAQSGSGVRAELRNITQQLAALTIAGETETEQFQALAQRAGTLKNALRDTEQTVSQLGADAPKLALFSAGVRGIGAAFQGAIGASALFAGENQDLQEVLVKVNATMAVTQAINEAVNLVKDEALITTAKVIAAEKINNAQIAIENALQSESAIARGVATVAQYGLNLAMSLSPVGIITVGIAALVIAVVAYQSSAREAAQRQEEFNSILNETGDLLQKNIDSFNSATDEQLAALDQLNNKESEKLRAQAKAVVQIQQERADALAKLNAFIFANEDARDDQTVKNVKEARDKKLKLEEEYNKGVSQLYALNAKGQKQVLEETLQDQINNSQKRLDLAVKNSADQFAAQRKLANTQAALEINQAGDDQTKIEEIRAKLHRQFQDIQIAEDAQREKEREAVLESAIIQAQNESRAINDRVSAEENARQNALIAQQAKFAAEQEGLSQSQRQAIIDKANQQILENNRKFQEQSNIEALQDAQSQANEQLSVVEISEQKKLSLRIDNIITAAAIEIEQNRGKVDKIKEIEAKRDLDIKTARLASIEDVAQKEIDLANAQNGPTTRNLERQLEQQAQLRNSANSAEEKSLERRLNIQKQSVIVQFAIIDQITQKQLAADAVKEDSLNKELQQGLISQKDYEVKFAQVKDDESKIVETAEAKKLKILDESLKQQREKIQRTAQQIFDFAQQGLNILQDIFANQDELSQQRLDAERQRIQDLSEAGAISSKEAQARNKQLDAQQKKLQHDQAVRDKQVAIFTAIINTAAAVTKVIAIPVLAAITAALGAAQIAVIASRPIPQFGKGKKGNYEGWGEVGETGAELLQRNGQMYIAKKPTITWLAAEDKVYNPAETMRMVAARGKVNELPIAVRTASNGQHAFDYTRFGRAVADNVPEFGVNFDRSGFHEYMRTKNSFITYLNKRRSWR